MGDVTGIMPDQALTVIDGEGKLPRVPTKEDVKSLELFLANHPGRLVEMNVQHHFAPGVYARELRIPAGVMLTGKMHKTEHLNIVSAGEITVWTENEGVKRITAPCTFVSKSGTKRVGLAHTDTVWTTIHVTDETDLDLIEAEVIEPADYELPAPALDLLKGDAA